MGALTLSVPGDAGAFPHDWSATVLSQPPMIQPARRFIYPEQVPGEEDALARGALLVQVRPQSGGDFLATCALGFKDPSLPTGVWSAPDPGSLLAVAGGYAYLVDTREPERCEFLPLRPVASLLAARGEGLLFLAGFHQVLALDATGVRWTSGRLSWEGVTLHGVRDGKLQGEGWDMFTDKEMAFEIDLRTGQHTGGGYRAG